ncbi:MAG: Nif11-like leader peptide family natural product precursor, partial [Bacilli bacterium]|nr:Nif11-like leader peptide family natural product precursor [Bacilli bacterium]
KIMKEELLKGLSEEQIAKLKECKNTEEILAVAKKEGVELTEEQLEAVSGGGCGDPLICPRCHGQNCRNRNGYGGAQWHICDDCKYEWQTDLYSGEIIDHN